MSNHQADPSPRERAMDEAVKRLYATTDASVWAEEWVKTARRLQSEGRNLADEGWMIGWFANAIETARNHFATTRTSPQLSEGMVERAARAITGVLQGPQNVDRVWRMYEDVARAALTEALADQGNE